MRVCLVSKSMVIPHPLWQTHGAARRHLEQTVRHGAHQVPHAQVVGGLILVEDGAILLVVHGAAALQHDKVSFFTGSSQFNH